MEKLLLKPESVDEFEEDPFDSSEPMEPRLGRLTLNDTSLSLSAEIISTTVSLEVLLRFRYLFLVGII